MTKKKKIIIAIISIVLAAALITSALIVIMFKKFRIKNFDNVNYSIHTSAQSITLNDQYKRTFANTHYQNGTELIQNNTSKFGLFSNISGTIVVPTNYSRCENIHDNADTNKAYFKFYNTGVNSDGFVIYDEKGNKVYDTVKINTYNLVQKVKIMSRVVDVEDDYDIETTQKEIEISDITFGDTYYSEGNYYYESWIITDKNGSNFVNIYSFEKGNRQLVQTIGESIGGQIDNNENLIDDIVFLKNGDFRFVTKTEKTISAGNTILEIKVFDDELELEKKTIIDNHNNTTTSFRIGNYYFIQQLLDGSEDNHSFSVTELGETKYYKLKTHRINLKNGKHTEISTDVFVQSAIGHTGNLEENAVNINTGLFNAFVIDNKEISAPILLLANDELDYTEIEYQFNKITKISKNRFLATFNGNQAKIINKTYKVIADLSNYTDIFTTEENIIVSDSEYTYICNHDGVVINRYLIGNILNVCSSDYYIVLEEDEENNVINYKRGHNGQEYETILTISNSGNDIIRENLSYTDVTPFVGKDYAYLLATQNKGSVSDISIFNFEGTKLLTLETTTQSFTPLHEVYDDHVIIKISDLVILLNR